MLIMQLSRLIHSMLEESDQRQAGIFVPVCGFCICVNIVKTSLDNPFHGIVNQAY